VRRPAIGKSSRNKTAGAPPREDGDETRNSIWNDSFASCGARSATGGWGPSTCSSSCTRSTMSCPFVPSASRSASRPTGLSSSSLCPSSGRTRLGYAWASVAYGSRACAVELAGAKSPRAGTEHLVQLVTTDDLPIPEYRTRAQLRGAVSHHASNARSRVSISRSRRYSRSENQQTADAFLRAERERVDPPERPQRQAPPKISLDPRRRLVAVLCVLGEELIAIAESAPGMPAPARREAPVAVRCDNAPTPSDSGR